MTFLGIDLGTSGLRALLIDASGKPIGSAEHSYGVSNPARGWSEQDPKDWTIALNKAVDELRVKFPSFKDLRGIGVAGHMHGATLLDKNDKVLRPCILWNDTRSSQEAAKLDETDGVRQLSANIVFPGFTAPKLQWIKNNEPDVYQRTAKVLLPAAYLNFYLTGDYVADMSDSAGTSWLDVGERHWSDFLLDAGGMEKSQMPNLVEGCEQAGQLRGELCDRWGLSKDVVVCGGAGDNAAAACGIGALNEGDGFVSLGTSGVVLVARDKFSPAPETAVHTFCHALPKQWYQMGVMLSATDCLNWLSMITGKKPGDLTKDLGDELKGPGEVRFLPYLSGERTPHNDADIRGSFTGLSKITDQTDLTRAVIEGVSFGLKDSLKALNATGADVKELTVVGGGSASKYWLSALATILDLPLRVPLGSEFGAALGAGRLAMIATTGASPIDVITAPQSSSVIQPQTNLAGAFLQAYEKFRSAYAGIKQFQ